MCKKILATLITVAMLSTMLAGFTVLADAEVTVSYVGDNMETTPTIFTDRGVLAYPEDEILNTTVALYQKTPGSDRTHFRLAENTLDLRDTGVLWNEYSIRFHQGFTRFNLEYDQASPALWIDDDGSLWTGGYNIFDRNGTEMGSKIGYTLELDKRYHIVTALDYTASNTGALTIWVNGKKVVDAQTPYRRLQGGNGFRYVDVSIAPTAADTANSYMYIDNFYVYSTSAIDSHPEESGISDASSSDGIGLESDYITVGESVTVGAVKSALTNGNQLIFARNGSILGDSDSIQDADIYAPLANGKGFRAYDIYVTVSYVGDDMETTPTIFTDRGVLAYPEDEILNTTVALYQKTPGSDRTSFRLAENDLSLGDTGVLWTEYSIRFHQGFTRFNLEHDQASPSLWIDDDGSLWTGGYNISDRNGTEKGSKIGYTLELDKRYHIVTALDYTAGNTGALTIWVNGKKVVDAQTPYSRLQGGNGFKYVDVSIAPTAADTANSYMYIDNFYIYTTPAIDSHPEETGISDASSSDEIGLEAGYITGAEDATVGAVKSALINGNKLIFAKNGSILEDADSIQDADIYAPLANGKGFRAYIVGEPEAPITNVMLTALNTIEASIRPRSDEYNDEIMMADGDRTEESLYKSIKTSAEEKNGLKVIASLNAVYSISSATVVERYINDNGLTVTIEIGKAGELTPVVESKPVNSGSGAVATTYTFDATEGDSIVYTFNIETHRWNDENKDSAESDYQIIELEAMGSYVEDVAQTGFAPEIGFWYDDWNGQIEDTIGYYLTCYNAGDEDITGEVLIAAYEGNKLVKCALADKTTVVKKGANLVTCMEKQRFYEEGLTYKAFFWNGAATMVPFVKASETFE